jgi:hypothetical protein
LPAPIKSDIKESSSNFQTFHRQRRKFSSGRFCRRDFAVQIEGFISNNTPLKYSVSGIVGKTG